jgi:hypothetical protein
MIPAVILLVSMLAGVCLIFGAVVALIIVLWIPDIDAAAQFVLNSYYLLIGLMPITLWFAIYTSHDDAEHGEAYSSPLRAILTTTQGALIGSVLGAGPIFLAVVIYLPVILAGFDIGVYGPTVSTQIVWSRLIIAVAAALISAFPLGYWAYYQKGGREI